MKTFISFTWQEKIEETGQIVQRYGRAVVNGVPVSMAQLDAAELGIAQKLEMEIKPVIIAMMPLPEVMPLADMPKKLIIPHDGGMPRIRR